MRKELKLLKRLVKCALTVLVVIVVLWLLGIFQWFGSFNGFLPGIPIPWLNGVESKNGMNKAVDGYAKSTSESDSQVLDKLKLERYSPEVDLDIPDTETTEISFFTKAPLQTSSVTLMPVLTPTVSPTPTEANDLLSLQTSTEKVDGELESDSSLQYDDSENSGSHVDDIFATDLPIATIEPTQAPLVVTDYGDIVKFSFDEYVVDELILNSVVTLGDVKIVSDGRTIVITSHNDNDFVEFTLTRDSFRKLLDAGFYNIEVPYRMISIHQVYQQIQETNTDFAEFKWVFDGDQYRYKAVIRNNYLDWLKSFPHGERFLIIE